MSLSFPEAAEEHRTRYPLMETQDFAKLAYQSEFGPAHMLQASPERMLSCLSEEWRTAPANLSPSAPEPIGGNLCRFPLHPTAWSDEAASLLMRLFRRTAESCHGTVEGLNHKLAALESFSLPHFAHWLADYRKKGCPALHHSASYRDAYHPHYRLIRSEYALFFPVLLRVQSLLAHASPVLIAIDGSCGSGKTTLAALLSDLFPCRVFHTDDFYLPIARRTEDWKSIPAGNMDLSRLRDEVLLPARANQTVTYRAFSCQTQTLERAVFLLPAPLNIVEGSYSLHPELADAYDLTLFLRTSDEAQERRLRMREGNAFSAYSSLWIPLEKQYHRCCPLPDKTLVMDTTDFF